MPSSSVFKESEHVNINAGHIIGGIGGLIVLYLVLSKSTDFGNVTKGIAASSQTLITTLQGR